MNPNATRLAKKFKIDEIVAEALVAAGYACPRKIRDASDDELGKVKGVGAGDLAKLRARWKAKK